jgi:hypothetical protein
MVHVSPPSPLLSELPMWASATLTTVPSTNTMADPRTAVISTQRPCGEPYSSAMAPSCGISREGQPP